MGDSLSLSGTVYGGGPDGYTDGSDNGSDVGAASTVFTQMLNQRGINQVDDDQSDINDLRTG